MDEESADLLARLRTGDDPSADEIFRRYLSRLTVLARSRLSPRLAQRLDPEDVVLSAFRSFFVRARNGEFSLRHSGDLWRLLVIITLHKLHRQAARHRAGKRSIDREVTLPARDDVGPGPGQFSQKPTAEEAVALADELEFVMDQLPPLQRRVLELRPQDHPLDEIATEIGLSERTVRRILEDVHHLLQRRLFPDRPELAERPVQIDDEPRDGPVVSENGGSKSRGRHRRGDKAVTTPATSDPRAPLTHHDFLLQLHLGTGGMGRVYRALQKSLNKPVAIKVLKKSRQRNPAAVERFLEEARTVARLRHPGIVGVHGIGRMSNGGHFLVMDLVQGTDLATIANERQITIPEAIEWVAAAAAAIAYAHSQGIVHCDLKPANILLDARGTVLVTDFGLAKSLAAGANSASEMGGTLGYMAPEQIDPSQGEITARTDVYGLGALLYSLLAGRPPFVGPTFADMLDQILVSAPTPLPSIRSYVPTEMAALCVRCIQKQASERYGTATEVAAALRGCLPSANRVRVSPF